LHALETRLANSSWSGDPTSHALGLSVKRSSATALSYVMHRTTCFGPRGTECEHAVDRGTLRVEWRSYAGGGRDLFVVMTPWSTAVKGKDGAGPPQVYLAVLEGDYLELTPFFSTCPALADTACATTGGHGVWGYFAFDALDTSSTAYCAGDYWVANPATYAGDVDCDWAAAVDGAGGSSIIGGPCPWVCSATLTSDRASADTTGRCVQRCGP